MAAPYQGGAVFQPPAENIWAGCARQKVLAAAPHIWAGGWKTAFPWTGAGDLEIAVPCLLLRRTFVLGIEQTHFDRLGWLLRVDDDRFARLNVHQLIFDLLFRFQ